MVRRHHRSHVTSHEVRRSIDKTTLAAAIISIGSFVAAGVLYYTDATLTETTVQIHGTKGQEGQPAPLLVPETTLMITTTTPLPESTTTQVPAVPEQQRTIDVQTHRTTTTEPAPIPTTTIVEGLLVCGLPESFAATGIDNRTLNGQFAFHNWERSRYGLPPLRAGATENDVAAKTATWMVAHGVWAHPELSTGVGANLTLAEAPAVWKAAENLGKYNAGDDDAGRCEADKLMGALMQSPEHRADILDPNLTYLGIARAVYPSDSQYANQTLVVYEFGGV